MSIPTYCVGGFSFLLACSCIIAVTCENRHSESWDLICHCHFDFQFCACWQCTATQVTCDIFRKPSFPTPQFFVIGDIAENQVKFTAVIIRPLWSIYYRYTFSAHVEGRKEGDKTLLFIFWGFLCV